MPIWDPDGQCYVSPATNLPLQTWDQAMDAVDLALELDPATKPAHVVRLGSQLDVRGLLGGTPDADRGVRYLCKYLTKDISATYKPLTNGDPELVDWAYEAHIDRLHAEVRVLPCSPGCANWLRYGTQPKGAGPGMVPGQCPAKAHDREFLGLGGRRVLVSRAWTGKTLTEHRAERATVVREALEAAGIEPPEARRAAADVLHTDGKPRYVWEDVPIAERDYAATIVASIAEHHRWKAEHEHAKALIAQRAGPPDDVVDTRSATHQPSASAA